MRWLEQDWQKRLSECDAEECCRLVGHKAAFGVCVDRQDQRPRNLYEGHWLLVLLRAGRVIKIPKCQIQNFKEPKWHFEMAQIKLSNSWGYSRVVFYSISHLAFLRHFDLCFCGNETVSKWRFEILSALPQIESKQILQRAIMPQTRTPLLVHYLTRFSMKFYYLYTWIRAPSRESEKCAFAVKARHNYLPDFSLKFVTHWYSVLFSGRIGRCEDNTLT